MIRHYRWLRPHNDYNDGAILYTPTLTRGLAVHHHIDEPGRWFYSAYDLDRARVRLSATTLAAAKKEALAKVRALIDTLAAELRGCP